MTIKIIKEIKMIQELSFIIQNWKIIYNLLINPEIWKFCCKLAILGYKLITCTLKIFIFVIGIFFQFLKFLKKYFIISMSFICKHLSKYFSQIKFIVYKILYKIIKIEFKNYFKSFLKKLHCYFLNIFFKLLIETMLLFKQFIMLIILFHLTFFKCDKEKIFKSEKNLKTIKTLSLKNKLILEECFKKNKKPSIKELENIANQTKLSKSKIYKWFHNKKANKTQTFSAHNLSILMEFYEKNKYLTDEQIKNLSNETDLKKSQINNWFKKQRYFEKKKEQSIISIK